MKWGLPGRSLARRRVELLLGDAPSAAGHHPKMTPWYKNGTRVVMVPCAPSDSRAKVKVGPIHHRRNAEAAGRLRPCV